MLIFLDSDMFSSLPVLFFLPFNLMLCRMPGDLLWEYVLIPCFSDMNTTNTIKTVLVLIESMNLIYFGNYLY